MTAKNREETIVNFLKGTKWENARRVDKDTDCSKRRYEYLCKTYETAILMDCPHSEPIGPFADVASILRKLGYTVPEIFKVDRKEQLAIVEYLPGREFELIHGREFENAMHKGIDLLIDLHKRFDPSQARLPDYRYSDQWYMFWDDLFPVWGTTAILNKKRNTILAEYHKYNKVNDHHIYEIGDTRLNQEIDWCNLLNNRKIKVRYNYPPDEYLKKWRDIWHDLHNQVDKSEKSLMLLDFHTPNLKYINFKEGIQQVGLLDFQDAVIGPKAYDVVSLVEDARRKIEKPFQRDLLNHYIKDSNISDYQEFLKTYAIMGARRNLRNIGSWYRFAMREYDYSHMDCINHHWFYLQDCLKQPVLKDLYELVKPFVPEKLLC